MPPEPLCICKSDLNIRPTRNIAGAYSQPFVCFYSRREIYQCSARDVTAWTSRRFASFCTRTPTKSLHPITKPTPGLPRPRQGSRLASGSGGSPEPPGRLSQSPLPRKNRSEEHTSELQSHSDLVCRL